MQQRSGLRWSECLRGRVVLGSLLVGCLSLLGADVFPAATALAGTSNGLMDISADGELLACSNRDSGTLTVIRLADHSKLHEIPVGHKPEGVSFVGDSHRVAVAVYADDRVLFLDADEGKQLGTVDVFDEPYGIVSNSAGTRIFVTLEYPGEIVEIDAEAMQAVRSIPAGQFLRGVALKGDERLFVAEYYTSNIHEVHLQTGEVSQKWEGAGTDNLCNQLVLHPHREKAYLGHIRSQVKAARSEGSIFPYLTIVDTDGEKRKRIPMDSFYRTLVVADPWEVTVSPDGSLLIAVYGGTNDMFVCRVLDDNYREIELLRYMQVGQNPRAVRVSPDNSKFYVYQALDFTVTEFDAKSLEPLATIPVTENPLDEEVLLGKQLFYTALQPMTGRRWISCASCHPDGHPDGRTWQNPEGLRNTPALFGLAWTHPQHWSADRDETQDFEHTIRGDLMQGRGLVRGKINDALGKPNKGLSRELDALAAYANSHRVPLSPHAKGGLSAAAERGRGLFFSEATKCASCHSGPFYTDSRLGKDGVLHDVGTGGDDPSELMGPRYDTPTLLGVYRSAPYLHHGKSATLEEVLTVHNVGDKHGRTSHLRPEEVSDLVEFLKSLPYEDPEPAARAAGLVQVTN